jgi:hypothetical protein
VAVAAALVTGGVAYAVGFRQADGKHQKAKAYSSPEKFTGPSYGSVEDMKHVSDLRIYISNIFNFTPSTLPSEIVISTDNLRH